MFPYIYAERNGIHIIDLVQTAELLTEACNFVRKASEEGKKFLFVGTKRQAAGVIAQEAEIVFDVVFLTIEPGNF
jgi:small subunit ribosomal protein S2